MPLAAPPPPFEPPFTGVHLNRTTLLSPRDTPPPDPAAPAPARGTQALRHFRTGPLKEAALLLTGPYRVEERLRRGATVSICSSCAACAGAGGRRCGVLRRRGLGRRLLAEVADWARDRGAASTYLQVQSDNLGARALYAGTGFTVHHAYHYRVAPSA